MTKDDQVSSGNDDYLGIRKIFHISLLYFKVGDAVLYHGKTVVRDVETQEKLSIHIEDDNKHIYDATEIFPEYIFISIPQFNDKVDKELDEWLYAMKNEDMKSDFKSPYMRRVAEKLNILKMSVEARNEYYYYMKELATYKDAIDTAEEKGIKRGIEQGIERGKAEEKIEIARSLLLQGADIKLIASATGLSEQEIRKLG